MAWYWWAVTVVMITAIVSGIFIFVACRDAPIVEESENLRKIRERERARIERQREVNAVFSKKRSEHERRLKAFAAMEGKALEQRLAKMREEL